MVEDIALRMLFADETEAFRTPEEPDPGDVVRVRLRVERPRTVRAWVVFASGRMIPMLPKEDAGDDLFSWYEAAFTCPDKPVRYRLSITCEEGTVIYQRFGAHWANSARPADPHADFEVLPAFHVPAWSKGALQYQIFPDRFCNGDPTNDVVSREYAYGDAQVHGTLPWDAPIMGDDYRSFRGGDLQGIINKLDYLQSLGVEALYLNPVFVSPSAHKYDVQDYFHIDPHLGRIVVDEGDAMVAWDLDNSHADRYRCRTTDERNLEASDALFARLCQELHERGMKVIVDGVFNHSGAFNRWMDRACIYGGAEAEPAGAFHDVESPYREFYSFYEKRAHSEYEAWFDFESLPKLNYERSEEAQEQILAVARHWARPPYRVDGWRLDVAADIGHSEKFNHRFWRRFRDAVKDVNPDIVLIAEHYGCARPWLDGTQWDTLMNYDAFMEPVGFFLTGMEKHSDFVRHDLFQNGDAFFDMLFKAACDYSWGALTASMCELSNHDHSRFLTRTNCQVGRIESRGQWAAGEGVSRAVMREAVAIQMTWPGAPTIYYGDEAGLVGWTDPDNRRTFPWGQEDQAMIAYHRALAALRVEHPCLRWGSVVALGAGYGWIAYGRFLGNDAVCVLVNNSDEPLTASLRLRDLGWADGTRLRALVSSDDDGFSVAETGVATVHFGYAQLSVPRKAVLVLGA